MTNFCKTFSLEKNPNVTKAKSLFGLLSFAADNDQNFSQKVNLFQNHAQKREFTQYFSRGGRNA